MATVRDLGTQRSKQCSFFIITITITVTNISLFLLLVLCADYYYYYCHHYYELMAAATSTDSGASGGLWGGGRVSPCMKCWMLKLSTKLLYRSLCICLLLFVCSPPMSGEFATSEWRVAVLSVGLASIFVGPAVLHARPFTCHNMIFLISFLVCNTNKSHSWEVAFRSLLETLHARECQINHAERSRTTIERPRAKPNQNKSPRKRQRESEKMSRPL